MMASIPITHATAPPAESLEEHFQRLRQAWERDTAVLSSMSAAAEHPAYQEIIGLGEEVVPLLVQDMEENLTHWFLALEKITGAKPYFPGTAGNIPKLVEAWVKWAKDHGVR